MTSGASWNDRGLSPELYEAAREAARRAGMSVEEWLDSTFGNVPGAPPARHPSRPDPKPASLRGARLTDTVARLNARLEQLTTGAHAGARRSAAEPVARDRPLRSRRTLEPGIDQVLARDRRAPARARRGADARAGGRLAARASPRRTAPGFRAASNGSSATSPRRSRRCGGRAASRTRSRRCAPISPTSRAPSTRRCRAARWKGCRPTCTRSPSGSSSGYGGGADPSALHGIEHRLEQMHAALNQMTPAEGSCGLRRAHRRAFAQDGQFRRRSPDPETLRYLEAAINELRELSAGVASAEGVASIAGDVQALGARIDHLARSPARAASIRWRNASTS